MSNELTSNGIMSAPFSEEELRKLWNQQADEFNQWESLDLSEQLAWAQARAIAADRTRAALAKPGPEGPGPVDYRRWYEAHSEDCNTWSEQPTAPLTLRTTVEALAWANYCLSRFGRPAIKPVPVSERPWEQDGWCDADEKCWWFIMDERGSFPYWIYAPISAQSWGCYQFSLPHHALPVPISQGETP